MGCSAVLRNRMGLVRQRWSAPQGKSVYEPQCEPRAPFSPLLTSLRNLTVIPMVRRKATPRIGRPPRKEGDAILINFRATTTERNAYQRAAELAGLSMSDWIRSLCDAAIARSR